MATTIIAGITKTVKYNRLNRDFDCFVTIDGGAPLHIGYARTEHEGEVKCDQYAYDYLSDNNTPETAAELLMQDAPTMGQRLCAARADILADEDATIIKLDIRTEAERRYDALKDGSAYVKADETVNPYPALRAQIDAATDQDTKRRLIGRLVDHVLADAQDRLGLDEDAALDVVLAVTNTPRTGDELPFGQLRDGTPILGTYDAGEPNGRSGLVHAYVNGMQLSAQEDPSLFSITNQGLEDMTIEQVHAVRAILNTDIPEQLLAAAIAHRRGDASPVFAPAKLTSAQSFVNDYLTAAFRRFSRDNDMPTAEGIRMMTQVIMGACADDEPPLPPATPASAVMSRTETGCEYTVNDTLLCIEGGKAHCLTIHGHVIVINHDYLSEFSDLSTLLSDATVQQLLGIVPTTPPAAPACAVRVVRDVCDDRHSPHFGREIGTDYACGESIIHFPDSGKPPVLITYDTDRYDGTTERNLNDLITLLTSPQVQAARSEAGVPMKKAA